MTRVNDFSFGTFFRKLSVFGALATAGLLFYGGTTYISRWNDEKIKETEFEEKKAEGMRRFGREVADENKENALKVANELKDTNLYSREEITKINSSIDNLSEKIVYKKRNSLINKLEFEVANLNKDEALKIANDIRTSGDYSASDLEKTSLIVDKISEERLYEDIIINSDNKKDNNNNNNNNNEEKKVDKRKLVDDFIKLYPDSPHRKQVVEELLFSESNVLYTDFREIRDFEQSSKDLVSLVILIESYSSEKPDFSRLQLDKIISDGEQYLSIKTNVPKVITVGSMVSIGEVSNANWDGDYFDIRESCIPKRTIGKVTKVTENTKDSSKNQYSVFFTGMNKPELDKGEYSSNEKGGSLARYHALELVVLPLIDEFHSQDFKNWLNKLSSYNMREK